MKRRRATENGSGRIVANGEVSGCSKRVRDNRRSFTAFRMTARRVAERAQRSRIAVDLSASAELAISANAGHRRFRHESRITWASKLNRP